jgi:hypothetical protein
MAGMCAIAFCFAGMNHLAAVIKTELPMIA